MRVEAILDRVRIDPNMFTLPDVPEPPSPELSGEPAEPLFTTDWDFAEQCRRLIDSKRYTDGAETE